LPASQHQVTHQSQARAQ